MGFTYTDEIFISALFAIYVANSLFKAKVDKSFVWLLLFFSFYIFYSYAIASNTPTAIFSDALVTLKPFLAFLAFSTLHTYTLSEQSLSTIKLIAVSAGVFLV